MSGNSSHNLSYAEVARTPLTSQANNAQTLSPCDTALSNVTNKLYCTIDTSRAEAEGSDQISTRAIWTMVENGMRNEQANFTWRF
jgi:hypothetical protein